MSKDLKIIFFDGVCNLCNSSVDFIVQKQSKETFFFSSLQSGFAKVFFSHKNQTLNFESIVLYEEGKFYQKSSAALRISRFLKLPWRLLKWGVILPRFLRDKVYSLIANNRYHWFGKKETCRLPTAEESTYFLESEEDFVRIQEDFGKR